MDLVNYKVIWGIPTWNTWPKSTIDKRKVLINYIKKIYFGIFIPVFPWSSQLISRRSLYTFAGILKFANKILKGKKHEHHLLAVVVFSKFNLMFCYYLNAKMTLMYVELKFYFIFISSSNGQRTKRPVFCCRSAAKLLDPSAFIDSEKLFYFGQGLAVFMVNENLPPIGFSDLANPNLTRTLRELYSLTWTT